MQVFRCWDPIHLNIICVQLETVLSLIRADWTLWLVGGCCVNLALLAALLPCGSVSWSVGDLVLCVGGVVFIVCVYDCSSLLSTL